MPALDQLMLLIEQNCWQDAALSAGNIFFCFTLIPMLRHPGRPPLLTCIPTALALLAGGFVFATMHLWVTALTQTITGIQWLALAFKKSRQTAAARAATTSPELQRFVAKRMGATTVETASSHVLMLSSPGLALDMIRKAFGVVQKA